MPKYDISRVSIETLRELVRANRYLHESWEWLHEEGRDLDLDDAAIKAVRDQARIPLRTRSQVDADLVKIIRANVDLLDPSVRSIFYIKEDLAKHVIPLLREETSD